MAAVWVYRYDPKECKITIINIHNTASDNDPTGVIVFAHRQTAIKPCRNGISSIYMKPSNTAAVWVCYFEP